MLNSKFDSMQSIESGDKGEIVMYQPDETIRLEVRVENETVWLNRQQMASLFGRDVKTIGKHINNALKEELVDIPTIANFATVQIEGGRPVNRTIEYYSLDMILSVGYRVKSSRGVKFRSQYRSETISTERLCCKPKDRTTRTAGSID